MHLDMIITKKDGEVVGCVCLWTDTSLEQPPPPLLPQKSFLLLGSLPFFLMRGCGAAEMRRRGDAGVGLVLVARPSCHFCLLLYYTHILSSGRFLFCFCLICLLAEWFWRSTSFNTQGRLWCKSSTMSACHAALNAAAVFLGIIDALLQL